MLQDVTDYERPFELVSNVSHVDQVESKNAAFYLYERAKHVFGEAKRVHDFREICDNTTIDPTEKVNRLGQLMNESHESCDKLY
jgi:N-acetylgalactosamine kinase